MTTAGISELVCLVCRSCLDISSSVNIFYTLLPRSGELLASFVLSTIRPSVTDLQSSYLCPGCYNLFQLLEQAQSTVTNIHNQILRTYTSSDNKPIRKDEIHHQNGGGISAIDSSSTQETPQVEDFEVLNPETVQISSPSDCPIETTEKDLQLDPGLPEIPNNPKSNGPNAGDGVEGSVGDDRIIQPPSSPQNERDQENQLERSKNNWKALGKSRMRPCPICDKKCKTAVELRNHIASHSSVRPYMCEKCGQAYKHKYALKVHIGMHNGVNPFRCSFCDKCFTQKGALMRHLPMHTGELPYQCDLCGKRFVHHTSYNMHMLSHTGKKSYQCHVCNASLLSTSHLKRHMRVHTGEKPFSCELCGKRFAERYNLFAHQRIHESSELIANVNDPKVEDKWDKKSEYKSDQSSEPLVGTEALDSHPNPQHSPALGRHVDQGGMESTWQGLALHTENLTSQTSGKMFDVLDVLRNPRQESFSGES